MVKLIDLINRGDVISITNGQLSITPKSGKPVPSDWLSTHQNILVEQISNVVLKPIYQFEYFNVGRYSARFDGLTMSFIDLKLHKDYFTIFNVSLSRKKKNGRLPGKLFNPPRRGDLLKFWNSSNLPQPRRPSELYKKINSMKSYLWQAEISKGNKLDSKTLQLANISYQQIAEAINSGTNGLCQGQSSGIKVAPNQVKVKGQHSRADYSGADVLESHVDRNLEGYTTTCLNNHGYNNLRAINSTGIDKYDTSKQGSTVDGRQPSSSTHYINKRLRPQDQSHEEWLADFDNATEI
ncbi:hypothetical protein ABMY47_08550 [Pseudoalteromonas sp. BZP1]|uniref:hypothetical protein n=1 Tax=unclassified Pseudoalteromonas TaxID=194690 RepID=UPI0032C4A063